ncbi:MAG: prepilin-type N-terminal cleavage/methylation domain-containing protein [Sedimentisphaerales bacterium]|nr:prepilin-type N-terminal cleavage/methylation domain-containing protein [Sedimentisphaerales bacterium]
MAEKKQLFQSGFTLVELMVSMTVMIIVSLAVGAVIVDGQNGWSTMYDKIHSDIFTDGYVVRKKFDSLMRRASGEKIYIGDQNQSVEVYYYSDGSATIDRYMRFYQSNENMVLEYGLLSPKSVLNREIICGDVSKCAFHQVGRSVQLILVLDNGTQKNTVITSAIAHN